MIIGGSKKQVIENIKTNLKNKDYNKKVEINDAVLTDEQVDEFITNFYKNKEKSGYDLKHMTANLTVKKVAKEIYSNIDIVDLDNLKNLDLSHGAIITCNHFNPLDSFNVRKVVEEELHKKLYIVIQDTNLAMTGDFGFLMNYLDMIPLSKSPNYLIKTFIPEMQKVLNEGDIVLIYPEEEMWFNYKKPRPDKRGAYQFAAMLNVPIISCFVEIVNTDEIDNDEFYKVKYIVHVLKPLIPDNNKTPRANSIALSKIDYKQKCDIYKKIYKEKLTYDFKPTDIAGLRDI